MKKSLVIFIALLLFSNHGFAQEGKKMPTRFQAVSLDKASLLQEGKSKMYCPKCGMTLPMFYKTNHAAHVDDKSEQYCSIHCLAEAMASAKKISQVKVVDTTSLKFIDAPSAHYVFGSSKPGTMSKTSKYAFAKKTDAAAFAKEFGGEVLNYEATLAKVKSTLTQERAMIDKKQAMAAKKGAMLYKKMCKPITATFGNPAQAKAYLTEQKPCGQIKGMKLQVIALYLQSRQQ